VKILILALLGCVLALGAFSAAVAQETPTPTPAARLQFAKSGAVSGNVITWTVSITNSGNADSASQTIQDILPAGVDWNVSTVQGLDCILGPYILDPTRETLACTTRTVPAAYFAKDKFAIVNGFASVTVYGFAERCGSYTNTAIRNGFDVVLATVDIACPTPVPTATATATPTQTQVPPTQTPTMIPTEVPTSTPTATPTRRVAPLPPNTGNAAGPGGDGSAGVALMGSLLIVAGLGAGYASRRGRREHSRQ